MGLLEEYNALKKKRNPQANTSEKTSSAGSNTTTGKTDVVSEYNKLKKEREQGVLTPDVQNRIKDFGSRYENAIKSHNNSVAESFWGKDASEIRIAQRANLSNVQALAKEAAKYRKYWGDETTDSILKSLEEIKGSRSSIHDNAEIFSTYKSEEEYNKAVEQYLAQQKEEEELLKVNIELGEKEIYDLELQRDNWREVDYNQRLQNVQPYTDEYWALQDEWYNWDSLIDEKKQYLEKVREFQEWNQQNEYYAGFKNNPDWAEKSKYERTYRGGEVISNGSDKNGIPMSIYLDTGYDDVVYDAINGDETARSRLSFNDDNKNNTFFGTDSGYLYHMTPDEIKTYNYLHDLNDKTASDAYLEFLHSELTARRRQADQMKQAEWAKEQPIRSSIFSVLTSPLKVISAVGQTADYMDDGKIDQNAGWNKYSYNSTAIRTQVASDIAASGKWGEVGSWTYNLGMSMGDFLMNTAVSGGNSTISLALMGSGAMADTVIAAKDRGLSDDQAFTLGVVAGAAEIVTEKFSLDALFKGGMSKGAVRYAVKNAFVEGTEEVSSSFINLVADTIVAKDKSEWEMAIKAYMAEHPEATRQQAEQKVIEDELLSLGLDFLGGVIMGGTMAGGGAAINAGVNALSTYAENNAQLKDTGRTIMSVDGGVDALKNLANEVAGVSDGKTQNKLTKQIGKVDNKATAKRVGKLSNAVESANNQANASANKADIAKSLQRKGFNAETANDIADALVAEYNGQELTKAQEKLLKSAKKSQVVKDAISNIMVNELSTMGQRSQNIRDFNADIAAGAIAKETGLSKDVVKALQEGDFEAALKMVGGKVTTETETAPESSYEVSADGKTINAKGDEITIVGIDSVGKGKLTLKLSDGSTIDSSEVSYSSVGEAMIYEAVANMDANIDADTAFKLVKAYDPASGISAEVYAKGLNQAYTYGFYGYKRSDMTAEKALSAVLTEEQRNFAYEAGREYAEKYTEGNETGIKDAYATAKSILRNREKNGQTVDKSGEVIFEDGLTKEQITKSKNGKQKNVAYLVAQKVSAKMGNDIHLYKGAKEFGFRAKSGDIWLNVNATADAQSMMLFTLSHELVHNARVYDPKGFKAFADFLVEQYGEHGKSVHDMVLAKQADYASQGKKLSYDKAYEEVVCDACERMLLDSNALEKLQLLEQKHPGIIERIIESIRNFLKHIREVFADVDPYADESKFVKEMESEAQAMLNRLFENMMVDSGKHYSTIKAAFGKGTVVETNADGEFTIAKSDDGSEMLYNLATWEKGGKETLQEALEAEGFSKEDIKAAMTIMDAKYDLVKKLGNEFNEQDRINQATITTDIKDGHSVLSALVSNGDYPVNIDLLMVCKKRKAYQRVINKLCETGMIQQATVDALAIAEINKILGKYGFETACLGCFVESRRLRIQEWANTIVKEWNSEVKKRNPNAKAFGFGKGEATLTQDEVMQLIGELESGGDKNDQGNLNLGKGSAVKRMGVLLDKVPSLRKTLSVEDLITPDGLTALRKFDSNLFSMVKSRYGSNSPKFVQEFNPYNHELAKYGKVPSEYKSLREYLYAIGGARMQSFSDFIVENWFDYCQIVADLAARKLPMHTYTKEIALAKLFGLTGIKINMSLIPDIDRSLGKEFAGLTRNANGELELIWADKDRFKATGGKSYMQSINFADAIALQNDPRYSANVGTIAVGVSDKHILMMLDDNRIRMIIPYHSSGMNPIFADLMGTSFYKDYTMFQNTTVKQLYNSKGEPVSLKLEKEQTNKLTSGFQFNAVLQELGDARAAAQAYKDWCADASKHTITIKGETYTAELTPKFDSFSWHDNYYKLLEDFNTYDCISEEAAQQGDVQQIYPEDFDGILRAELTAQDKYRQKQEENQSFDKAMGEIESYLSTHSKADTVYYAEQNGIKLSDKDKKLNADEKRKLKALRDADMKMPKAVTVQDVVSIPGTSSLAVNIDSKKSGLQAHRKGKWASIISEQIRKTLAGKAIYAADGDIITVTNRGAREVSYGTDSNKMMADAKKSRDYSKFNQKMITAEHAASIIALSTYSSWSSNTEDPTDAFKRDGLNYRSVNLYIDGAPYTATVVTCLNDDPTQGENYGEKFYDIESIENQPNQSALSGTTNLAALPHKIMFADDSTDKLTVAQKNRIVKRRNTTYAVGDAGEKTAMQLAYEKALSPDNDAKLPNTLRDAQTAATREALEKQNEKLREDVSYLKELLNLQRSITGGKKITRSSVETVARTLKKELGATGNSLELAGYLNQLYSFIAESDELTWEGIAEKAQNAVAWLREHGNVENDSFKELSDQELLRKVYDGYWGVSTLHTVADVKQKEINKLKAEHRKRMQAIKESHEKSIANLKQQQKQRIEDLREFYHKSTDRKLDAAKERYQEQRQRGIENREKTAMRQKIRKIVRDLDKLLNRGNKKTNVKEDMKGFVSKALELADYLFTDHISNDELIRRGITVRMTPKEAALVKETEGIISQLYDNADSLTDEEFTRLDAERKRNLDKLRDLLTAQRNERLNTPVYKLFNDLITEYASLNNSKQEAVKAAYDPNVERFLRSYIGESDGETDSDRKTLLQNMRVADMTTDELWKLHNAYKMVLHSVRDANKLWVNGKMDTIEQMVGRIIGDFSKRKTPDGKVDTVTRNLSNKLGWNYEKLYYALDRIGSEAFTELVMNIANSENIVMQDVLEAAAFRDEMVKKYGYNNWDVNKKIDREFLDNTGKKFELTLGELMSLYAYSRRKGAWDHIEYGGFVFGKAALTNPKPADSYKLSKEQCEAITDTLTNEQKAYAEDMQKFLSETMGEKGNEVSMLLYGITMFGEKNYFPIHIAGQFKAQANESQAKATAGFSSMSNAGFTHAQNPNAKAPFVLEGFNEIWADHVNEMSRYHGTVPALEDMRRVMNRSFYSETGAESISIKQLMENSFGKEAVEYFDNLYREANSGAITDKLQKWPHKLLSKFRKNSVAYSLSVLIQQPASVVRAYALIPKKYFRGIRGIGALPIGIAQAATSKWTKSYKNAYAEMLKYAPGVTTAKEIGGFDTATGGSIRSYLLDTNKSFKLKWKTGTIAEKGKSVMGLLDDNVIANLPNVADKIAWIEIWIACKRETVAKHKDLAPNSDAFMQIVGERFTEVIRATQVYDSIFAKSPMLKSKNLAVQYLVSFMNEANTTANLVESAFRDFLRGDIAKGFRKLTSAVRSIAFAGVLRAIIYAMRDDDEDETYIEKYTEALVENLINDITVFNYIPIVKDAWSAAQGYDVERPDMSIVSDAISSLTNVINNSRKDTSDMTEEELEEWDKKVTEANWKLADSICAFFGIPVKNVRREINALMDHARIAHENSGKTTWNSIADSVWQGIANASPSFAKPDIESNTDKLYDAIVSGDTTYANRLKGSYKSEDAYHTAVRKALRENDSRIKEAAIAGYNGDPSERVRIAKLIEKDGFEHKDVVAAINSEIADMEPDEASAPKEKGYYTAKDFAKEIANGDTASAKAARADIIETAQKNGKSKEDAEESFASSARSELGDLFIEGKLSESKASEALKAYCPTKTGPLDDNDVYWIIRSWNYEKTTGSSDGYGKYKDFQSAVQTGKDLKTVINEYTSHGVEEKTLAGQITDYFKPLYKEMSNSERASIKGYLLNAYVLLGYDRTKKSKDIDKWLED